MGTLLFGQIKKQASSFLQDKYKIARLVLTDVTEAELLTEEITSDDPSSPETRTMMKIAAATFDVDDYWRIVDVLHRKFGDEEMKWRQSYKALVLLEFLLTHGSQDLAEEFLDDLDAIRRFSTFHYIDDKGFDWGGHVRKRADHVQDLLLRREELMEARLKALKITREIKGFGNSNTNHSSPSSSSSSSSPISANSKISSSDSFSSSTSSDIDDPDKQSDRTDDREFESLIEVDEDGDGRDDQEKAKSGLIGGVCAKLFGFSASKRLHGDPATAAFRNFSSTEKVSRKCYDRRHSLGY